MRAALILAVLLLPIAGCREAPPTRAARTLPAESAPYVASPGREVFHRPSCQWAKKIRQPIGYPSREDAILDGRRPCRVCQP